MNKVFSFFTFYKLDTANLIISKNQINVNIWFNIKEFIMFCVDIF
ncbi:hypothetical protein [Tepidibacter aestuarii]|nr:hypothetical protein [Tepidibacter aestuarii]CAH2214919.1 protein of unknown function [Tepidibacter aestuarii]